ncbi:MAG: phenylalanyl-tRNA synthetase subunit beta [Bacteroides sp. SM23_62_1]|nr:MAG: phenylalanyl-tRNA synthetase subunit beta [Bacteroides sp. SM23_62_1]
MNISYNWLKEYISLDHSPEELADILTNIGLEVEGIESIESISGGLQGCVIGEVIACETHPGADKLSIAKVDIGKKNLSNIVCGAPNIRKGQKVVVATPGTTLYKGTESITIQRTKIRGVISEGMICAEDELGLGDSHEGIMVVDQSARKGMPAADYFKVQSDTIFEIGLTPNRIDSASHFGVARDLAAYLGLKGVVNLKRPDDEGFYQDNDDLIINIQIKNTEACRRYAGVTISGVHVQESPQWLKTRLLSIGQSPINNVVDITNFILHELGQPLHAFNADQIAGRKVIVRTMKEGTEFISLDGNSHTLSQEDLIICNAESGMCIAGIIGGIGSSVTGDTKNVFLESAWFNPVYIRRSAKRHGLNTEASFRFERGADPEITVLTLKRAATLIREIAGGRISSPVIDVYPEPFKHAVVTIRYKNFDRLIGKKINPQTIKKILDSLEIKIIKEEKHGLILSVPPFRVDVNREADVIEEVLRLYGYNNVEFDENIHAVLSHISKPDKEKVTNTVSDYLVANSFNEIITNSLTKEVYYKDNPLAITLNNPLSNDLNRMRTTLFYGGMETIVHNINRQRSNLRLFEIGNCYSYSGHSKNKNILDNYSEKEHLALFITGTRSEINWIEPATQSSFYQLKAYIENIFSKCGIKQEELESDESSTDYISEGLALKKYGRMLAEYGLVNKKWLEYFDLKSKVYYGYIDWTYLLSLIGRQTITYRDLPRFPEVRRDLSMVLEKNIRFEDIRKLAMQTEKNNLINVILFDVYEGEKIEKGKKSYAISFVLQDRNKTLTDSQIEKIIQNLSTAFEKHFNAQIRKS